MRGKAPRGVDRLDDLEEDMGKVNKTLAKHLATVKAAGFKNATAEDGDLDADAEITVIKNKAGDSIGIQIGRGYCNTHLFIEADGRTVNWDGKNIAEAIANIKKAQAKAKALKIVF